MKTFFSIIFAADLMGGIGKEGRLPWNFPSDMKWFKETTLRGSKENALIMGRKTWESLPEKFRPLPYRKNIVISSKPLESYPHCYKDLELALESLTSFEGEIFIIGGARLIEEGLKHAGLKKVYLTRIQNKYECDTFARLPLGMNLESSEKINEKNIDLFFEVYKA